MADVRTPEQARSRGWQWLAGWLVAAVAFVVMRFLRMWAADPVALVSTSCVFMAAEWFGWARGYHAAKGEDGHG